MVLNSGRLWWLNFKFPDGRDKPASYPHARVCTFNFFPSGIIILRLLGLLGGLVWVGICIISDWLVQRMGRQNTIVNEFYMP